MDFEESVKYITEYPRFKKNPSLDGIKALLSALGNPEDHIKTINVAGTNGKGSTVAMLASVLSTAGYKTGRYVSPFVLEFRERMMINGKMIGRKRLAKIMSTVREHADALREQGTVLNAFEVTTAAALLWFAEEECDVVVLEVVSVESVEPVFRAAPDESGLILGNAVDRSRRESVGRSVVGDRG